MQEDRKDGVRGQEHCVSEVKGPDWVWSSQVQLFRGSVWSNWDIISLGWSGLFKLVRT